MLFPIKRMKELKQQVVELVEEYHKDHVSHKSHTWVNDSTDNARIDCSCGATLVISGRDFLSMHNKR